MIAGLQFDLEKQILGSFLLSGDPSVAVEQLAPEDFTTEQNQVLFDVLASMWRDRVGIDVLTAQAALVRAGKLSQAGGEAYLLDISAYVSSSEYLPEWVKEVKEASLRRKLLWGLKSLQAMVEDPTQSNEAVLGESEAMLHALAEKRFSQGFQVFRNVIPETLEYLHKMSTGRLTGCPTGLVDLDRVTGGLQPTDLIILAGRPGMGKTSLGVSIAWRAAKQGRKVGLFTLEMGKLQIAQRILCSWRNINLFKLRTGKSSPQELEDFRDAIKNLQEIPLHIDEGSRKTPLQILSQARRLKHSQGLDLLMMDHLQLGRTDRKVENRAEMLEEFAYAMKAAAKDLEIPVVCMAQLSRKGEQSKGEPNLSDLKGSGGIEEAADIVGFIHRPEVYDKGAEHGLSELIFGKYRNGPAGDAIKLRFNHDSASFSDYVQFEEPGQVPRHRQISPEDYDNGRYGG